MWLDRSGTHIRVEHAGHSRRISQGREDAYPFRMARSCVKGRNMSTNYLSAASARTKNPAGVIATCGLMIMFDGYDLVVYGAVAPALLKEKHLGA